MSEELYSAKQVADRLGLHVRTVRNYVRDKRLKAVRIGKQYRISREDLEAMTGRLAPINPERPASGRDVEVSSIVQIDAIDPDGAIRMANALVGAANSRRPGDEPLRIETIYDRERARMKIIVVGGLDASAALFKLIGVHIDSNT